MIDIVLPVSTSVRVIHALLLQTYFNPDEYWQCLEIAHQLAFGYTQEALNRRCPSAAVHLSSVIKSAESLMRPLP